MNDFLSPPTAAPIAPRKVYLHLADNALCFARYERRADSYFDFALFPLERRSSFSQNLRHALDTLPILQAPFTRLEVLVPTAVTPFPIDDFEEEAADAIYNYCFASEKPRKVFYDALPGANCVLLYALDIEQVRAINALFPQVHYSASLTALLQYFSTKGLPLAEGKKRLFIHLHEATANIAVFEGNKLFTVNSYAVQSPTDVSYYAFNLALHTAMNQQEDAFYVYAPEHQRTDILKEMQPFVKELFAPLPSGEFNRHIASTTPDMPYALLVKLLLGQ